MIDAELQFDGVTEPRNIHPFLDIIEELDDQERTEEEFTIEPEREPSIAKVPSKTSLTVLPNAKLSSNEKLPESGKNYLSSKISDVKLPGSSKNNVGPRNISEPN